MELCSLECRFRRILVWVFMGAFLAVGLLSAFAKYIEVRNGYVEKMRSQVMVAQELILDFIFKHDGHVIEIVQQCPTGSVEEVKQYIQQAIHFHEMGDLYYLLDGDLKIVLVSGTFTSYVGLSRSHDTFLQSSDKISKVHQSLFSNKSVVSMQYPLSCGMTLVVERSMTNVIRSMRFFDKGRMFPTQTLFVLSSEGTVVYHSNAKLMKSRHNLAFEMEQWQSPIIDGLFSYNLHGERFFAYKQHFSVPRGWTIYFSVPTSLLFAPIKQTVLLYLAFYLIFVGGIFTVLQFLFNRYFSIPVGRIVESLESYDVARSEKVVVPRFAFGVEEFARIIDSINSMADEVYRSSEQVQKSEEQIRLLLNSTAEAIYGLDVHGRCTFCNASFLSMMGYEKETDVLGMEMHQLTHHSRPDGSPYPVEECLAHQGFKEGKKCQVSDEVFWRSDGTSIPVEYWSYPIHLDEQVIGVVITFIDITERKEAEEKLAAEKEQLAVTLRSIGDAVITTDIDGNVLLVNKVAEDLIGWSQSQARGRLLPEVFHVIDEQSRELLENPVNEVLQTGKVVELGRNAILVSRDGVEREIADSGAPIRDNKSRIVGVVLVFRDVTEQKRMQDEAHRARKLESIGVLAGGIAHDFNNILMAIMGNISLVKEMTDNEQQKALLAAAEKASTRATGLTQQLLTFAKGGQPVTETASIAGVIKESAGFVLHGSNVACDFTIPDDLHLVSIDKGQISQVIQNIVLNGKAAMPDGGRIIISCENYSCTKDDFLPLDPGFYVRILITDSGPGIAAEHIEKIFDPYFTTKLTGQGLGLAVTRSIINKHNGHISVQSENGKGTTFTLYLPVARKQTKELPHRQVESRKGGGAGKVLIMDDEQIVLDVASNMLTHLGYEVLVAANGEEMLAQYQQAADDNSPVSLVIIDLTIPGGMGGQEAMSKLLEMDPAARAVVASGYSNDPVMANYGQYGFKGAITKPFKVDDLAKVIVKVGEHE